MTEQKNGVEEREENRSVQCQVELYRQLREHLFQQADAYRRRGKEQLADVILRSLE